MNIWRVMFERNSRILSIELNDKKIDQDISSSIVEMQRVFKAILDTEKEHDYDARQQFVTQLQEDLVNIREKLQKMHQDIHTIIELEKSESSYIRINDNSFIIDKLNQITLIISNVDAINDIVLSSPTHEEYVHEFYAKIKQRIEDIRDSVHKMLSDDKELQHIYERILDL
jgi:hypothetical protein